MTAIRCSSMEGPGRARGLLPLGGIGPYAAGVSSAEAGEMTAAARPVPPSVELTEGSRQKTPRGALAESSPTFAGRGIGSLETVREGLSR